MLVAAAAIAAASLLFFFAVEALGLGYGVLGELVIIGAAAVAALGLVAAAVVAVLAFVSGRAMSLRARTFWVIVVVVLIPSACLAAFGVWAYVRSWERAEVLYTDRAYYEARELSTEIGKLGAMPVRLTPTQRARLSEAIVSAVRLAGPSRGRVLVDHGRAARPERAAGVGAHEVSAPEASPSATSDGVRRRPERLDRARGGWAAARSATTPTSGAPRPALCRCTTPFDRLLPLGLSAWRSSSSSACSAPGSSRAASCGRCAGWRRRAAGSPKAKPASPSPRRDRANCASSRSRSTT